MSKSFDRLIRAEVRHFEPYLPGRSIENVRREHGLTRVIKLASNENPLGPSPRALRALVKSGRELFRYPDGASTALREAVAASCGVHPSRVIIGAGSDELIELLGKTYLGPSTSIVVSAHAFTRYRMAGELMGAAVLTVPMKDMTHDLEAMAKAVRADTRLVFIANPNNPTGTYNDQPSLTAFLERIAGINRSRECPVLVAVDEAYYEYARSFAKDYPDTRSLQKVFDFLIVLRTFSKAHALAGLRIGYGLADPAVIQALDRVRPPFNVSLAAQAAGAASLADRAHVARGVALVARERPKLTAAVRRLGIPVVDGVGNFFLMDVRPRRGRAVFEALLARGIIVRSMDEYEFPNHVRVTYGRPDENRAFVKALTEVWTS